jgi:hypothetical protein
MSSSWEDDIQHFIDDKASFAKSASTASIVGLLKRADTVSAGGRRWGR